MAFKKSRRKNWKIEISLRNSCAEKKRQICEIIVTCSQRRHGFKEILPASNLAVLRA